ncbi:MAG: hypothetical protein IJC73_07185 [Lentisphaeria bacterium]|nr:hypothetical protein [Lentisphaeria bacterium]
MKKPTEMTWDELTEAIRHHNHLYWDLGTPAISDADYDDLIRELTNRDPAHPLLQEVHAPAVAAGREIALTAPMMSLDKVYSLEDLLGWLNRTVRNEDEPLLVEPKYDGISCRYADGILITRGKDGRTGEDITDKLPLIELECPGYTGPVDRPVRGEILIRPDRFQALRQTIRTRGNTLYSNSRNVLTGLMMLKETTAIAQVELGMKISGARLSLVDYSLHSFATTPRTIAADWPQLVEKILALPYPTDGIVIKLADAAFRVSLGSTAHHPRGEMAYKFTNRSKETVLTGVEWSFGKSCLTPVALLEPVEIGGTTIKRASLHNLKNIIDLGLGIGDIVTVERAGDVIPHITARADGTEHRDPVITYCPGCGTALQESGPELVCPNPDCFETRLCCLSDAVGKLKIDNLGDATLRQLMTTCQVRTLRDLFRLTRSDLERLDGFARKSADNLATALEQARRMEDYRLLAALNIPHIGVNMAKLLLREHPLAELRRMSAENLAAIKGVGPERAAALVREFAVQQDFINELLDAVTMIGSSGTDRKPTVCFTGKMPDRRSRYAALAEKHGYEAVDSVSGSLDLLVAADPSEQSTKLNQARHLNIRILALEEFLTECGEGTAADEPEQLTLF